MKDLRDPTELGHKLEAMRVSTGLSFRDSYDKGAMHVRDYVSPVHPHDRYGDPRKIPSTMPNAAE